MLEPVIGYVHQMDDGEIVVRDRDGIDVTDQYKSQTTSFKPVTITYETLDRLTKEKKPGDLIALYMSYAAITQWQETTTIKATTDFMAKRLSWGRDKIIATKKKLEKLGLVESIAKKDENGKVTGHYVKINYITTHSLQSSQKPEGGKSHTVDSKDTSASNYNISASNLNKSAAAKSQLLLVVNRITGRSFRTLPERGVKKTLDAFTLEEIEKALTALAKDDWHKDKIKELSIDYLIRSTTIDKFLGIAEASQTEGYVPPTPEEQAKIDELNRVEDWNDGDK